MRRAVALAAGMALLSYVLTGTPIMLRMAAAHAAVPAQQVGGLPCQGHGAGAAHQHHSGGTPDCDHDHCLFCQGGVGPGVLAATVSSGAPSFDAAPFAIVQDCWWAIRHFGASYASRAPPLTI